LIEKLDLLRARADASVKSVVDEGSAGTSAGVNVGLGPGVVAGERAHGGVGGMEGDGALAARTEVPRIDFKQPEEPLDKGNKGKSTITPGQSKKEKLREVAAAWSKDEVRWEKERRRKANRAKKAKRKKDVGENSGQ
jgi:hypothetical protein